MWEASGTSLIYNGQDTFLKKGNIAMGENNFIANLARCGKRWNKKCDVLVRTVRRILVDIWKKGRCMKRIRHLYFGLTVKISPLKYNWKMYHSNRKSGFQHRSGSLSVACSLSPRSIEPILALIKDHLDWTISTDL